MKKSTLKEVIQNIVAHKLNEGKYGYIMSGKGTEDPVLQMTGFGNMLSSQWKAKIIRDLKDVLKRVEAGDWHNAEYLLQQNSVLVTAIKMMDEIYTDPKLKEDLQTSSAKAANPTVPPTVKPTINPNVADDNRDRAELEKHQKTLDSITNDIRTADANIAKRMDAVNKANRKDINRKQQLTKKQGPVVKKIEKLKRDISDYSEETPNEKI